MKRKIIANWKMNGSYDLASGIVELLSGMGQDLRAAGLRIILCPPFVYMDVLRRMIEERGLSGQVVIGAQDCGASAYGAHTGEVSAKMLEECGCKYVLIGHSEVRKREVDGDREKKLKLAYHYLLDPIYCVGESISEGCDMYEGLRRDFAEIRKVVLNSEFCENRLYRCNASNDQVTENFTIAYEPRLAIGTGTLPSKKNIEDVSLTIKEHFPEADVVYGGSVNESNISEIASIRSIDGVLVGGASIGVKSFFNVISSILSANTG